jgi:hypothetical protein
MPFGYNLMIESKLIHDPIQRKGRLILLQLIILQKLIKNFVLQWLSGYV